jgi:hypothetical protein
MIARGGKSHATPLNSHSAGEQGAFNPPSYTNLVEQYEQIASTSEPMSMNM